MAREKVRIQKESYRSDQFNNLVDREFKTFVKPELVVDTDTVEELFRLYNKLFYTIPAEGETNSHQYLIEKSLEVVDFEKSLDDFDHDEIEGMIADEERELKYDQLKAILISLLTLEGLTYLSEI